MANLWLKIKVGTKIAIFAILTIATLVFIVQNVNKSVTIWFWNEYPTTLLKVLFFTVLVSVIFTLLLTTTFRTIRQIREIRSRSRSQRLEEEIRDMKSKASMLQTKPPGSGIAGIGMTSSSDLGGASEVDRSNPPQP